MIFTNKRLLVKLVVLFLAVMVTLVYIVKLNQSKESKTSVSSPTITPPSQTEVSIPLSPFSLYTQDGAIVKNGWRVRQPEFAAKQHIKVELKVTINTDPRFLKNSSSNIRVESSFGGGVAKSISLERGKSYIIRLPIFVEEGRVSLTLLNSKTGQKQSVYSRKEGEWEELTYIVRSEDNFYPDTLFVEAKGTVFYLEDEALTIEPITDSSLTLQANNLSCNKVTYPNPPSEIPNLIVDAIVDETGAVVEYCRFYQSCTENTDPPSCQFNENWPRDIHPWFLRKLHTRFACDYQIGIEALKQIGKQAGKLITFGMLPSSSECSEIPEDILNREDGILAIYGDSISRSEAEKIANELAEISRRENSIMKKIAFAFDVVQLIEARHLIISGGRKLLLLLKSGVGAGERIILNGPSTILELARDNINFPTPLLSRLKEAGQSAKALIGLRNTSLKLLIKSKNYRVIGNDVRMVHIDELGSTFTSVKNRLLDLIRSYGASGNEPPPIFVAATKGDFRNIDPRRLKGMERGGAYVRDLKIIVLHPNEIFGFWKGEKGLFEAVMLHELLHHFSEKAGVEIIKTHFGYMEEVVEAFNELTNAVMRSRGKGVLDILPIAYFDQVSELTNFCIKYAKDYFQAIGRDPDSNELFLFLRTLYDELATFWVTGDMKWTTYYDEILRAAEQQGKTVPPTFWLYLREHFILNVSPISSRQRIDIVINDHYMAKSDEGLSFKFLDEIYRKFAVHAKVIESAGYVVSGPENWNVDIELNKAFRNTIQYSVDEGITEWGLENFELAVNIGWLAEKAKESNQITETDLNQLASLEFDISTEPVPSNSLQPLPPPQLPQTTPSPPTSTSTPTPLPQFGACGGCWTYDPDRDWGCTPPNECRLINDSSICSENGKQAPCCLRDESCKPGFRGTCGFASPNLQCSKCQRFQNAPPGSPPSAWCTAYDDTCGSGKPAIPRLKAPNNDTRIVLGEEIKLSWYAYGEEMGEFCAEQLEQNWSKWDCGPGSEVNWNSPPKCQPDIEEKEHSDRSCWGYYCSLAKESGGYGIPPEARYYKVMVKGPAEGSEFEEICKISNIPDLPAVGQGLGEQYTSCNFTPSATGTYQWKLIAGVEGIGETESETRSFLVSVPPSPPTNLTYSCSLDASSVTLSWDPPSAEGNYRYALRVDNLEDGPDSDPCSVSSTKPGNFCVEESQTSYTFAPTPYATYNWWVHAINNGLWSDGADGEDFSCTPANCPEVPIINNNEALLFCADTLPNPSHLALDITNWPDSVRISWDKVEGQDNINSYRIAVFYEIEEDNISRTVLAGRPRIIQVNHQDNSEVTIPKEEFNTDDYNVILQAIENGKQVRLWPEARAIYKNEQQSNRPRPRDDNNINDHCGFCSVDPPAQGEKISIPLLSPTPVDLFPTVSQNLQVTGSIEPGGRINVSVSGSDDRGIEEIAIHYKKTTALNTASTTGNPSDGWVRIAGRNCQQGSFDDCESLDADYTLPSDLEAGEYIIAAHLWDHAQPDSGQHQGTTGFADTDFTSDCNEENASTYTYCLKKDELSFTFSVDQPQDTPIPTFTPTITVTVTPTPTSPPTPTLTPTITTILTPSPTPICDRNNPDQLCGGVITVRTYIDLTGPCNRIFDSLDRSLSDVEVSLKILDDKGQVKEERRKITSSTGFAFFTNINLLSANYKAVLEADFPSQHQGNKIIPCSNSPTTITLEPSDFAPFRYKLVTFRAIYTTTYTSQVLNQDQSQTDNVFGTILEMLGF